MTFEDSFATQGLWNIAVDLYGLKEHPPLRRRDDGTYEGEILSFVKGLRISAQLIYFIRDCLSENGCDVSWGHILNDEGQSCSPECDVIIHNGHVRKWNGSAVGQVMDFRFVRAKKVRAVVSCKSNVTSIEEAYPAQLRDYGVERVFLFGECCSQSNYENLKQKALTAGYAGFWCAYFTSSKIEGPIRDESVYKEFRSALLALFDE